MARGFARSKITSSHETKLRLFCMSHVSLFASCICIQISRQRQRRDPKMEGRKLHFTRLFFCRTKIELNKHKKFNAHKNKVECHFAVLEKFHSALLQLLIVDNFFSSSSLPALTSCCCRGKFSVFILSNKFEFPVREQQQHEKCRWSDISCRNRMIDARRKRMILHKLLEDDDTLEALELDCSARWLNLRFRISWEVSFLNAAQRKKQSHERVRISLNLSLKSSKTFFQL